MARATPHDQQKTPSLILLHDDARSTDARAGSRLAPSAASPIIRCEHQLDG